MFKGSGSRFFKGGRGGGNAPEICHYAQAQAQDGGCVAMARANTQRRAVNLSLSVGTVTAAKNLGINMSEIADRAIADAVAKAERHSRQARMDDEMERYNEWSANSISVADEYGTLRWRNVMSM